MMKQITTVDALREATKGRGSIGFVPTMGALHAGHMALVKRATTENDFVVVSIFVNPLQFGANEDLESYPRQLEVDAALLEAAEVGVLYVPKSDVMYPDGFSVTVPAGELGDSLCGVYRLGHFDGVTTVVAKLFDQIQPSRAYFGEKDFQQLSIISKMVADLSMNIEIVGVPTVREEDGLAMSSRNQYLSASERQIAPKMYEILQHASQRISAEDRVCDVIEKGKDDLKEAGFDKIDYLELVDATSLASIYTNKSNSRLVVAAFLGKTRLIDNVDSPILN